MRIPGILLALLTLWGAGFGVLMLLWRSSRALLWTELLSWPWIFGAGTVTLALTLVGTVLPAAACFPVIALLSLGLGAVGLRRFRAGGTAGWGIAESRPWEKWSCLLILVPIGYMAAVAWRDALVWDGLLIWEAKARHAFLAGGTLPGSYFSDATRVKFHPNYPLFLPFTELWVYLWTGEADQTAVKVIFPVFFATLILLLWSIVRRLGGKVWMATATALLPLFVPLMMDHGLGLLQGYADLLLGTVYLAAVGGLLMWRIRGIEEGWYISAACVALLPWIKQEGLLLFASIVLPAVTMGLGRRWKRAAIFVVPGAVVLVGWKLAMHLVNARQETVFFPPTFDNIWLNLPRLQPIIWSFGVQVSQITRWSLLWYAVPLALVWMLVQRRKGAGTMATVVVLPLLLDIGPYVLTRLDLKFHITTSMERLIVQVSPIAVLCLGLALVGKEADAKAASIADHPEP